MEWTAGRSQACPEPPQAESSVGRSNRAEREAGETLGQAQAAPMGRLPRARPPRLPDALLGIRTGGSSRVGAASGSARVACIPPKATAGGGAREAHGAGVKLWAEPRLPSTGRVTHREDTHADWGLQQARHLEPSHPAAAGAGARPALSTATYGASSRILCRKPGKLLRTDRAPGVARAPKDWAEGRRMVNRAGLGLTNRPLRNSSYSRWGQRWARAAASACAKACLPHLPPAGGGASLGLYSLWAILNFSLQVSVYRFASLNAGRWSYLRSLKFTFTFIISRYTKLLVSVLSPR